MAAIDELNALLENLPNYALLTDAMKNKALEGALIPGADGVWPGQDGYVPTYDVYFAALNLTAYLKAQPAFRSSSSEGSSLSVDAPDWTALTSYFRSMSPIIMATGGSVLTRVPIPEGPHVRRTNMRDGGPGYDDVDTDLG
jgi:hypothetical protein